MHIYVVVPHCSQILYLWIYPTLILFVTQTNTCNAFVLIVDMCRVEKNFKIWKNRKIWQVPSWGQTSEFLLLVSTCRAGTSIFFVVFSVPEFLHSVLFAGDFAVEMVPRHPTEALPGIPEQGKAVMCYREKIHVWWASFRSELECGWQEFGINIYIKYIIK